MARRVCYVLSPGNSFPAAVETRMSLKELTLQELDFLHPLAVGTVGTFVLHDDAWE